MRAFSILRNILLLSLLVISVAAQQRDPSTLPTRDSHEKLTIAAEPVADAARSKEIFGKKHPQAAGLLAVNVHFKNENDSAVSVALDRVRLLLAPPGGERQRLQMLSLEAAITMMANPEPPNPKTTRRPGPLPIPRVGSSKSKDWQKVEAIVRPLSLEMDIIPPHATVHGYIFFDLNHRFELLAHSKLYLPDLKLISSGQALMFFELDLAAAPR